MKKCPYTNSPALRRGTVRCLAYGALLALNLLSCATPQVKKHGDRSLYGMIYDQDNRPVTNAAVYINGKYAVSSDIQGHFAIPKVRPKRQYMVSVKKENYEEIETEIAFPDPAYILYLRIASAEQLLAGAEDAAVKKEWHKAETLLSRARQAGIDRTSAAYLEGVLAFSRHRYTDALAVLIPLSEEECHVPYLYLFIADIFQYYTGNTKQALVYLDKFLSLRYDPEVSKRREGLPGEIEPPRPGGQGIL